MQVARPTRDCCSTARSASAPCVLPILKHAVNGIGLLHVPITPPDHNVSSYTSLQLELRPNTSSAWSAVAAIDYYTIPSSLLRDNNATHTTMVVFALFVLNKAGGLVRETKGYKPNVNV
jgi:hypothetical protein